MIHLSAKTEYACLAVLELAIQHENCEPVRIRTIAETHGIPSRFLVQILLQLKAAGIVESTRGAAGGYQLGKEPGEISLAEVVSVIEGYCDLLKSNTTEDTGTSRILLRIWQHVSDVQRELLEDTTFADLVRQASDASRNMYYI